MSSIKTRIQKMGMKLLVSFVGLYQERPGELPRKKLVKSSLVKSGLKNSKNETPSNTKLISTETTGFKDPKNSN
jgi:hypothetical protein